MTRIRIRSNEPYTSRPTGGFGASSEPNQSNAGSSYQTIPSTQSNAANGNQSVSLGRNGGLSTPSAFRTFEGSTPPTTAGSGNQKIPTTQTTINNKHISLGLNGGPSSSAIPTVEVLAPLPFAVPSNHKIPTQQTHFITINNQQVKLRLNSGDSVSHFQTNEAPAPSAFPVSSNWNKSTTQQTRFITINNQQVTLEPNSGSSPSTFQTIEAPVLPTYAFAVSNNRNEPSTQTHVTSVRNQEVALGLVVMSPSSSSAFQTIGAPAPSSSAVFINQSTSTQSYVSINKNLITSLGYNIGQWTSSLTAQTSAVSRQQGTSTQVTPSLPGHPISSPQIILNPIQLATLSVQTCQPIAFVEVQATNSSANPTNQTIRTPCVPSVGNIRGSTSSRPVRSVCLQPANVHHIPITLSPPIVRPVLVQTPILTTTQASQPPQEIRVLNIPVTRHVTRTPTSLQLITPQITNSSDIQVSSTPLQLQIAVATPAIVIPVRTTQDLTVHMTDTVQAMACPSPATNNVSKTRSSSRPDPPPYWVAVANNAARQRSIQQSNFNNRGRGKQPKKNLGASQLRFTKKVAAKTPTSSFTEGHVNVAHESSMVQTPNQDNPMKRQELHRFPVEPTTSADLINGIEPNVLMQPSISTSGALTSEDINRFGFFTQNDSTASDIVPIDIAMYKSYLQSSTPAAGGTSSNGIETIESHAQAETATPSNMPNDIDMAEFNEEAWRSSFCDMTPEESEMYELCDPLNTMESTNSTSAATDWTSAASDVTPSDHGWKIDYRFSYDEISKIAESFFSHCQEEKETIDGTNIALPAQADARQSATRHTAIQLDDSQLIASQLSASQWETDQTEAIQPVLATFSTDDIIVIEDDQEIASLPPLANKEVPSIRPHDTPEENTMSENEHEPTSQPLPEANLMECILVEDEPDDVLKDDCEKT